MLSVAAAQEKVLAVAQRSTSIAKLGAADALGLVIAEDVISDVDLPPFRKSMMDGFAVCSADCAITGAPLAIVEEITAGRMPSKNLQAGQSARIMTGAPLPDGSDAVVMIEQCTVSDQ